MFVRIATPDDASSLVSILSSLDWHEDINKNPSLTENLIRSHLAKAAKSDESDVSIYIVAKGDNIIGYATLYWMTYYTSYPFDKLEGYISEFYIHLDYQNKGVGTFLLGELKKIAKEKGCSKLTLISVKSRHSYTFYKRKGWKEREDLVEFDGSLEE